MGSAVPHAPDGADGAEEAGGRCVAAAPDEEMGPGGIRLSDDKCCAAISGPDDPGTGAVGTGEGTDAPSAAISWAFRASDRRSLSWRASISDGSVPATGASTEDAPPSVGTGVTTGGAPVG